MNKSQNAVMAWFVFGWAAGVCAVGMTIVICFTAWNSREFSVQILDDGTLATTVRRAWDDRPLEYRQTRTDAENVFHSLAVTLDRDGQWHGECRQQVGGTRASSWFWHGREVSELEFKSLSRFRS